MSSSLQHRTWLAVVSAYQTCAGRYAELLRHFDLSTSQFELLNVLHNLGGAAQPKQIAEQLLVTKGNVTGLLQRLGSAGWVQLAPHANDGRAFLCTLTPKAAAALPQVRAAAARFIEAQTAPFSEAEMVATELVMNRMNTHLHGMDIAALARGTAPKKMRKRA